MCLIRGRPHPPWTSPRPGPPLQIPPPPPPRPWFTEILSTAEVAPAPVPAPLSCQAGATEHDSTVVRYRTDDFADFYRASYPRVVAGLRFAGAAEAADLAQEAFARTLRHWRRVRQGSNPAGYVATTAFRLMRRQRGKQPVPLDEVHGAVAGPEAATVVAMSVHAALVTMPARRRETAVLCLYLELSAEEAAEAMGVSASTVRVQLHRARDDLRAALADSATLPGSAHES
ncbi:MAG: sigma-70 family RNA polymerase sigma factor [Actinobacteria bacterium]|nr:sigma-70 family RNA polymerase sigma factor [Actinomycetota bacterium]